VSMADYRANTDMVGLRPRFFNRSGTTEPDLVLIKQVEQVTTFVLEGPLRRFARVRSIGITDAVGVLVFLIWQLPRWLLFGCKNSQERPRATCLRTDSPAMLPAPTGGFTNRATSPAEPLLRQIR
jgi:hypothetical protein